MDDLNASNTQLSLTPLGAGDLIDRAVRFYRKNFWTFIWIGAPPILVGTLISVGWTMLSRALFNVDLVNRPDETFFYYLFLWGAGSLFIWFFETVATLTVMGGASRNFVRHLLFGEPLAFRETYRNVKSRVFGLLGASAMIAFMLGLIAAVVLSIGCVAAVVAVLITAAAFSFSPFLVTIISILLASAIAFATGWLFFLVAGNFAYVPQVMLVEGAGVFPAMGRSSSLARGNASRLYALFVFTLLAIYSALALFYVPLGWYAWIEGVEFFTFDADLVPAWYQIASQLIWQISLILLTPVWMIGLCLLYIDERVRHEGYDIELMAARRLGEIPAVPQEFVNPLQPALAQKPYVPRSSPPSSSTPTTKSKPFTTLGLD
jgi:hypothetical protein